MECVGVPGWGCNVVGGTGTGRLVGSEAEAHILFRAKARDCRWGFSGRYVEADGFHELEGVAGLHDAGLEFVVEDQAAVLETVFEVAVDGAAAYLVGDTRKGKIVGADDAEGTAVDEAAHDEFGAGEAVVGVCSGKQFIEEEENRSAVLGEIGDALQFLDFGIETGHAAGE